MKTETTVENLASPIAAAGMLARMRPVLLLLAGIAIASVASPAQAQSISACVGPTGLMRNIPTGTVCRPWERLVTWSITGPPGADATRPAGPCFDNANRYVDCGNGTVTDTVSELVWLKQANCFGTSDWAAANRTAAGLKDGDCGLADGSSPGDWRLPTYPEWFAMVARAVTWLGCFTPSLTNDAGTGCYGLGGGTSMTGVATDYGYWSSTAFEVNPSEAHFVNLDNGDNGSVAGKVITSGRVWPVRGGAR